MTPDFLIDKVLRAASRKVRQVKNFKNESYFADPVHMSIEEHNVLPQLIKIYTRVANRWLQDRLSGKKDFGTNLNEIVLYDGVAGIPIALRNAFDSRVYKDKIKQTIMLSKKLLSKYMDDTKQPTLSSGLFFGLDGIMLGNTLINEMLDIQSKKHSAGSKDSIKENTAISSRDFGYVDLISGEIGTALKRILALDMMGEGKIPINRNIIQKLSSDYQLISRRCLDKENSANEIFFGLAHGLAGVVYYLGECYSMKHDSKIGDLCLKYSDLVYQISSKKKNVCMVPVSTKNDKYRNYWCHGNPGVAISFIKAYENLHEKRYSNYIIAILNGIDEITVRNVNGLSLCHGFAGVGETYLRAAGALDDSKWLSKASEMLQIILLLMGYDGIKFVMRTKGLKYVYNEDEIVGLMTGLGGIVRFSVDYFLRDSISPAMTYPV